MITPSFGLTATERVLPKLALDFTTASLDSRVTFTRTTDATHPATYTNSSGVITAATNNQPRFDYDPETLTCKGLLIEESRANIILYSDYSIGLTSVPTISAGVSATTYALGLPSNSALAIDTSGGLQYAYGGLTYSAVAASTQYTMSIYVKRSDNAAPISSQIKFVCGNNTINNNWTAIHVGNNVYRISASLTSGTSNLGNTGIQCTSATGIYYVSGIQCEAGAFATSYIPTTSAALTRNADVATMTGTDFSDWFNASEGTFSLTSIAGTNVGYASGAYTQRGIEVSSATNAYMTIARLNTATTARLLVVDGTTQVALDQSNYTQNTASTFTFGYKLNNYGFAGNGATTGVDTSATVPTCSTLNIGKATTSEGFLNGWIQKINYYPSRLTNAELQAFSKG